MPQRKGPGDGAKERRAKKPVECFSSSGKVDILSPKVLINGLVLITILVNYSHLRNFLLILKFLKHLEKHIVNVCHINKHTTESILDLPSSNQQDILAARPVWLSV